MRLAVLLFVCATAAFADHRIAPFETGAKRVHAEAVDARQRVNAGGLAARGRSIVVAVIDSGIDLHHPALKFAGGWDFAQNDPEPEDVEGHGTHVAGIIAANSATIRGVAPEVTLLVYKVVHRNGDGRESSVVAALERCIDPNGDGDPSDHVDVVNLSLGWESGPDSITARAVDAATAAGIVVVAAAGNTTQSPARVTAPGNAATAITVANAVDEREMAFDSARGPAPATLAFKPDLAAPGTNIVSTFRDGTMAALSGTSMAAPHVAGVAALLLELHPDWTPAQVKSALVSTARAMNGAPLGRGSGFVDALAAHQARFFVDGALSFGVNGASTGTFDVTRNVTIANRSAAAATFDATAVDTPGGLQVTVTPSSFTLAAGASRSVSVRITATNTQLPFPNDALAGGTIRLQSGATTINVPWGLVRAARATITYDGPISSLVATSPTRIRLPYSYATGAAEMFVPPGQAWDFVLLAHEQSALRMIVRENVAVAGDVAVITRASDASRRFTLDARDANGVPLGEREQGHAVALRILADAPFGSDVVNVGSVRELFVSPLSNRYRVAPFESLIEEDVYAVAHEELAGAGKTLTQSSYVRATVRASGTFSTLVARESGAEISTTVFDSATSNATDVYLSKEGALDSFPAISLDAAPLSIPLLRAFDGNAVISSDRIPSPTVVPVSDLGAGPVHPFAFFGTASDRSGSFVGASGESYSVAGTSWSLGDASGTLDGVNVPAIRIEPRARFVATTSFRVAGHASRGELEVVFGTQTGDLAAPTLTSLRVQNDAVRFSVADFDDANDLQTRPLRRESIRVSYRALGTLQWLPLQPAFERADEGTRTALGRIPAGDLFRADLPTMPAGFVDLRIEAEDAAGNRMTWTLSPAFAVGNAQPPPRRRAAR